MFLLTLSLAQVRGRLSDDEEKEHLRALRHLPDAMSKVLALEPQIMAWSELLARRDNMLFLGRGMHYPIALEGALKMKEISYIHAEAYPAGELKHGPLALVSNEMPVIAVAPNDMLLEKLRSNMHEVSARNGRLLCSRMWTAGWCRVKESRSFDSTSTTGRFRRFCIRCRCNCSRITLRWQEGRISISQGIWRSR